MSLEPAQLTSNRGTAAAERCAVSAPPGTIYVSAGEPSGDRHAAKVVRLLTQDRSIRVVGTGGAQMRAAGARLEETIDGMGAIGFAEVLATIPRHVRQLARTRARLRRGAISLLLAVDYPGYNLRLARSANKQRIPVLYYLAPQLWAWGGHRIKQMQDCIAHVAAILPFEEDFFSRRGVPTTFVGHPLVDNIVIPNRASARDRLGIGRNEPVLALCPGSRSAEVRRHWAVFRRTAERLSRELPGLRVVVAGTDALPNDEARGWETVWGDSLTVMAAADVVLGKSGTTTLEASVVGRPMCIAYKMHRLSYHLAKRLITCEHIGLVNLVLGRRAVPEFVQDDANEDALTAALLPLFDHDGVAARGQLEAMREAKERLGVPGAAQRVSDLAMELAA